MTFFAQAQSALNAFIWGPPMLAVFLFAGAWFTLRSRLFPLRRASLWLRATFGSLFQKKQAKTADGSITQWQALTSALAACLGTGNIVGVATALQLGGPGAVFWMWVSAALGMMTCCAENILGVTYRWRTADGKWMGGPMAYLERGLKSKPLAAAYAALLSLASFGIGNMTQANAIAEAARQSLRLPELATGILVAVLAALVIFGGVRRIAKVTEYLVPFMTLLFLLACAVVLADNITKLPGVLGMIFAEAFRPRSLAGFGVWKAMRYGIARGVFSNEAGLGSSAVIHAAADVKEPAVQGFWGIAEVFIDTILMCTVTALVFLCAGAWQPGGPTGVALASASFAGIFGAWGSRFVSLSVALFAFATLTGWSFYGEQGARYLIGEKGVIPYRALYIAAIILGCALRLETVWAAADILNGLMAIPNLIGLMALSGVAIKELRGYEMGVRRKSLR
ncbi:MAG: sodium:alanine symporter family protein [Oscillospiraceae bacterium]|jgi:AGCS family alanine or glycine:cation symporter|nr:sodium:alanine symporter family protein [Oscillospiraceae bacterium]